MGWAHFALFLISYVERSGRRPRSWAGWVSSDEPREKERNERGEETHPIPLPSLHLTRASFGSEEVVTVVSHDRERQRGTGHIPFHLTTIGSLYDVAVRHERDTARKGPLHKGSTDWQRDDGRRSQLRELSYQPSDREERGLTHERPAVPAQPLSRSKQPKDCSCRLDPLRSCLTGCSRKRSNCMIRKGRVMHGTGAGGNSGTERRRVKGL